MPSSLTSHAWWVAAGRRAAYTALATLLPLAGLLIAGQVSIVHVGLVVGLAVLASLATSLASLPEVDGRTVPMWLAITQRVARTAGQVLVSSIGSAVLLSDVDWRATGIAVGGAALTTLVRTVMFVAELPEEEPFAAPPEDDDPDDPEQY